MCDCIEETNKLLSEHNTVLVTTMFRRPDAVVIATDKLDTKKRGKPALMIASYCPFCGGKYDGGYPSLDAAPPRPRPQEGA